MLLSDSEEKLVCKLTEAISSLAMEVHVLHQQRAVEFEWHKSHSQFATKHDLEKLEKKIMAEIAAVVADLKEAVASIKQVNVDITDTQTKINTLNSKIGELNTRIAELEAGGGAGVPQEIADLAAELKGLGKAADDALPNPVVVPPVPVV